MVLDLDKSSNQIGVIWSSKLLNNLKESSGSSSLMTAFTIPAISKPFFITLGLFRLAKVVLQCRKNFGGLKILDGFIFGHFICLKLKPPEIFC